MNNNKKMIAIWACDKNNLIGKKGFLPWNIPADLKHFKEITSGQTLLMGRKTFEGMGSKALPNRTSIILSQNKNFTSKQENVLVLHSVDEVLDYYRNSKKTLFIVGGASIYATFSSFLDEIIVTKIDHEFEGDSYFPKNFPWEAFTLTKSKDFPVSKDNPYPFTINYYKKIN